MARFPPPLGPQLLIRDPERTGGGIRIGERLYGALDMALGPRRARPFSELMERLADAGLPCRFSVLIEGGGLAGLDAAMTNVAAAFLAFSSDDSLLVRNAMRDLTALGADAHAIVRLRLGLLTWVAPEDGEDALRRRSAACSSLPRAGVRRCSHRWSAIRWKASPRLCRGSVAVPPPSPRSHH